MSTILPKVRDNGQGTLADVLQPTGPEGQSTPRDRILEDSPAPNPFDPTALRLSQDFASSIGVKKVLTTVPCRKPNRHEFIRVRPGEDWRLETGVFEDKVNRDTYLVQKDMWAELIGEVSPVCLFLAIRQPAGIDLP